MELSKLKAFYEKRGSSANETEAAVQTFSYYKKYVEETGKTLKTINIDDIKQYIIVLTEERKNTLQNLIALARINYLLDNKDVYIYFTQILERENIIPNMREHIEKTIGKDLSDEIYSSLMTPAVGAPPETAVEFTKSIVESLESRLSEHECRKALTANAHGMPKEAFQKEREKFLEAESLEAYLDDFHCRSVKTMKKHAKSGEVWYEQIISNETADFVKENKEVLGGVLRDEKILWTKIPFKPSQWLKETDPEKKRYLACHCPVAREALNEHKTKIPKAWCHCTSGYIQQRFNAIFDQETDVECLESVLNGDDVCRFAITVPKEFL